MMLVVDDDVEVRRLFVDILESGGFACTEAGTAEEAWGLLEQGLAPGGMLLDLRMPGMGGLRLLLRLRADARYSGLPVAIVTGECFIDTATQESVAALDAVVRYKPLDIDDVLTLAQRLTRQAPGRGAGRPRGPRPGAKRPKRPAVFQK